MSRPSGNVRSTTYLGMCDSFYNCVSGTISFVRAELSGHDRAPATLDREPTPELATALSRLRVQSAFFLRGEYSEAWAFESMPAQDVAAALLLDTDRVVLFHVIASGRC